MPKYVNNVNDNNKLIRVQFSSCSNPNALRNPGVYWPCHLMTLSSIPYRGRLNFGFGFGFGAECEEMGTFGGHSVSAESSRTKFGAHSVSACCSW